jgi:[ribosomal protein S18]-alanine N-acetyltransferase
MVEFRRMKAEDVPEISRLEREAFSMPWSEEDFEGMIRSENARYYVAEKDGVILGGCGLYIVLEEGSITNVVIRREARNQGVGTELMRHMMEMCGRDGVKAFTLEVRVSNKAAIHMYEKVGFVSEGIRPGFYEKPAEDAMIMWKR